MLMFVHSFEYLGFGSSAVLAPPCPDSFVSSLSSRTHVHVRTRTHTHAPTHRPCRDVSSVPMEEFAEDVPGNIARGHAVWNTWFGGTGEPLNVACFCTETTCDDQ